MIKKEISELGAFIRRLRFEHNESGGDMAAKLGVTRSYISLMEGKQPLNKKMAVKIIQCYDLSGQVKQDFIDMVTRDIVRRFWEG